MDTLSPDLMVYRDNRLLELAGGINSFREGLERRTHPGTVIQLQEIAAEISSCARAIKETCDRGDSFPQFLEVVAKAFGPDNVAYLYTPNNFEFLEARIGAAVNTVDLTMAQVSRVVYQLRRRGIKADYLTR